MLPVGVGGHYSRARYGEAHEKIVESCLERLSFSKVDSVAEEVHARSLRQCFEDRRVRNRRAIVDHNDL
jgi:hypothetical protein